MKEQQGFKILHPLWVRILIVVFCFGWAYFEYSGNAITWAIIFILMGIYGFWSLILNYKTNSDDDQNKD